MSLRSSRYIELGYNSQDDSQDQLEQIEKGEIFLAQYRGFTWYFRKVDAPQAGELPEGVAVFRYYAETSKTTKYTDKFKLVEGGKNKIYCGEELRKYILLKIATFMKEVNPKTKHMGTSDLGAYIRAIPSEYLGDKEFRSKLQETARRAIDNRIAKTSNLKEIEDLGDLSEYVKEQIVVASGTVRKIDKNTTVVASDEEIQKARETAMNKNRDALGDGKK